MNPQGTTERCPRPPLQQKMMSQPSNDATRDDIEEFCEANGLDEEAMKVLQDITPGLAREVLNRGPVIGARNPNAVILSRVRQVQQAAGVEPTQTKGPSHADYKPFMTTKNHAQVKTEPVHREEKSSGMGGGGYHSRRRSASPPPRSGRKESERHSGEDLQQQITDYVQEHDLDSQAEQVLRDSEPRVVKAIFSDPLTHVRNASAVVVSRCRNIASESGGTSGSGSGSGGSQGGNHSSSQHGSKFHSSGQGSQSNSAGGGESRSGHGHHSKEEHKGKGGYGKSYNYDMSAYKGKGKGYGPMGPMGMGMSGMGMGGMNPMSAMSAISAMSGGGGGGWGDWSPSPFDFFIAKGMMKGMMADMWNKGMGKGWGSFGKGDSWGGADGWGGKGGYKGYSPF